MATLEEIFDNIKKELQQLFSDAPKTTNREQLHSGTRIRAVREKLLILEDEVDLCLLVKQYLVRKNFEVYISHTISDALSRAKEINPDFIIVSAPFIHSPYCIEALQKAAPNARR